jgi:hypothetical protein
MLRIEVEATLKMTYKCCCMSYALKQNHKLTTLKSNVTYDKSLTSTSEFK